ncbi:hypothetical protein P3T76_008283 [Phytophthora citrophthora]|uniref:Helicase-associated domain-containing protein n=1 Tax=Phytophthora citrophthora TaxID=4793 RepID=A0AAD9GK51_9STRA|nr:hypothetical protein P3T76_008283 [Phytophthora citrophthora]
MLIGARRFLSSRRKPKRFASLATALQVFHEQNGHFLVPYTFQVPTDNSRDNLWPEETRGLNLGRQLGAFIELSTTKSSPDLQSVRHQLDAVGFPDIRDWRHFQWTEVTLAALKTFKQIEGHMLVSRSFEVPKGDLRWPKPTWGLKLGVQVNVLRRNRETLSSYQVQNLEDIGFVWVVIEYNWDVVIMPGLRRYRELYGHCRVPQSFVAGTGGDDEKNIPENWPSEVQGCRLGSIVNSIRAASAYSEFVERDGEELKQLGFNLSDFEQKWQEIVLPALQSYHRIHGHCDIPVSFVVPEEESWPQELWGMGLGFIARNIRNRGDYFLQVFQDYEKLEDIGFVCNANATKWQHGFLPALETYVQVHGNANIPARFVVPAEYPWPNESHGLRLGEFVANKKPRKRFADFIAIDRAHLEELGFFWSDGDLREEAATF